MKDTVQMKEDADSIAECNNRHTPKEIYSRIKVTERNKLNPKIVAQVLKNLYEQGVRAN